MIFRKGPSEIKSENARLNAWIYIDIKDIDVGTYVKRAKEVISEEIQMPDGYSLVWSGQYEYMERAKERLKLVVPLALVIIFILLYMNFKSVAESLIVMLSLPFAMVGGVWLMYLLGYNMSVAVSVGFIALAGLAAETGVIMLLFLDMAYEKKESSGGVNSMEDLHDVIFEGASQRIRPKMMTFAATFGGLLPIMWGTGTGSEVMRRIAAPMVGGIVFSMLLTLIVIPVIYAIWKGFALQRKNR